MPVSFHTVTIGTYLQMLPQVAHLLDKAEEHCRENGLAAETLTGARLAPDMWNFAKQVQECSHHSARAITGLRNGVFGPELEPAPLDFASLRAEIDASIALLQGAEPAEIDGMVGRDVRFEFGTKHIDFTAEDFILSFAMPNFYFHVTTVYDILRNLGLAVGKGDYLGRFRKKG